MNVQQHTVGMRLRDWRRRRRLTQFDLALQAEISPRHLSFVETGRSQPSREMIQHLAEHLGIPPRERNVLLVAAGYAPIFPEHTLNDPALAAPRAAIEIMLEAYKPYPAYALDRHWNVVASNRVLPVLFEGVAPDLLKPPINAVRLSLHANGMAPRIENLSEWRAHILHRLRRQVDLTADPVLAELQREVLSYPAPKRGVAHRSDLIVPYIVRTSAGRMSFFTTTMVFGTPIDITLSELMLEALLPADAETAEIVRKLSATT